MMNEYCCYCGKDFRFEGMKKTKEHVVPKSKGGNNSRLNKLPCCRRCNGWRANKSFDDWKAEIEDLINRNQPKPPFYHVADLRIILINISAAEEYINNNFRKLKK